MPSLTTSLSTKGQIIIPKQFRAAHNWRPGQRLEVVDTEEGILLKAVQPFVETSLEQVAVCLPYYGKAKTLAEMDEAIRQGAEETSLDRS